MNLPGQLNASPAGLGFGFPQRTARDVPPEVGSRNEATGGRQGPSDAGWPSLFRTAFRRSQNAMVLADEHRVQVDVNAAYARLLGRRRSSLIGHHLFEFVEGGPLLTDEQWRAVLMRDEFAGEATMKRADGDAVRVQWAAHPELVTGHRMILFVALNTSRSGRHFRRAVDGDGQEEVGELSERELEIVRLVAHGASGPEIADRLHISHNTVRTHVHNAMVKVGARSRAHLVAKALGTGLLSD